MKKSSALEPGKYYHIYNRGNRGNIFHDERSYAYFLKLYTQYVEPVADTFAYCLMRNHLHLFVRIKTELVAGTEATPLTSAKVVAKFTNLFNAYERAIRKIYNRAEPLFADPKFGRVEVANQSDFTTLVLYIHQNPQKHQYVANFREWPQSSYHAYLSSGESRLKREEVLGWFNGKQEFANLHRVAVDESAILALVPEDVD